MTELYSALAFSLAAISCAAFGFAAFTLWLGYKRQTLLSDERAAAMEKRLENRLLEMRLEFEQLSARTKKSIENITEKVDEAITKVQTRVEAQEMKMGMNGPFSTAGRFG